MRAAALPPPTPCAPQPQVHAGRAVPQLLALLGVLPQMLPAQHSDFFHVQADAARLMAAART